MTHQRSTRARCPWQVAALLAALLLSACRAGAAAPPAPTPYPGAGADERERMVALDDHSGEAHAFWTVVLENDLFSGQDGNYTNGFAVARASREIGTLPEDSLQRRFVEACSFLPGVGEPGSASYLLLSLGQTMFTPDDTDDPDPPPDERPYAGVLFLDTAILSRSERHVRVWNLKLGVVGPSSGAEHAQKFIHDLYGGDEPRGWDTQLEDEPVVNLDYQHGYLLSSGRLGERLDWELMPNAGAAFGNYIAYANLGLGARIGVDMPDAYGSNSVRAGTNNPAKIVSLPDEDWSVYLLGTFQAFALGWFLPLDGNTWRDSRGVDSEELVGIATFGVGLGHRGWLMSFTYSIGTDLYEGQEGPSEWGALSLTWSH